MTLRGDRGFSTARITAGRWRKRSGVSSDVDIRFSLCRLQDERYGAFMRDALLSGIFGHVAGERDAPACVDAAHGPGRVVVRSVPGPRRDQLSKPVNMPLVLARPSVGTGWITSQCSTIMPS